MAFCCSSSPGKDLLGIHQSNLVFHFSHSPAETLQSGAASTMTHRKQQPTAIPTGHDIPAPSGAPVGCRCIIGVPAQVKHVPHLARLRLLLRDTARDTRTVLSSSEQVEVLRSHTSQLQRTFASRISRL